MLKLDMAQIGRIGPQLSAGGWGSLGRGAESDE